LALLVLGDLFEAISARMTSMWADHTALKEILMFTKMFTKLARPARRRNSISQHTGHTLEARRVPTVTASLSAAGSLTLTGDNVANNVVLSTDAATGNILLKGQAGTQVIFQGITAAEHILSNVNSIKATFGAGNDVVAINDMVVGSVNINLGAGVDSLTMARVFASGVTVVGTGGAKTMVADDVRFGTTSISTGAGLDSITLSKAKIVGGLSVSTGSGNDIVALNGAGVAGGLRVLGALKVNTSDGNDTVTLSANSSDTIGSLSIDTGIGDDVVAGVSGRVLGSASIKAGDGTNSVQISDLSATSLSISTGVNNDTVQINNVTVLGSTSISTSAGSDTVDTDLTGVGDSHFGSLSINLGENDNHLRMHSRATTNSLSISSGAGVDTIVANAIARGSWTVNTGAGADAISLSGGGNGNFSLNSSSGTDTVSVAGNLVVRGNTSINTGTENDVVNLIAGAGLTNQFGGNLSINMGNEADVLTMLRTRVGGNTTITGDDLVIDDSRFLGTVAATLKGNTGTPSVSIEQSLAAAGRTDFNKLAQFTISGATTEAIRLGSPLPSSKAVFHGGAKFTGSAAVPVTVFVQTGLLNNVEFNGPAPTFSGAVRVDLI
jgi:hypothetical protein